MKVKVSTPTDYPVSGGVTIHYKPGEYNVPGRIAEFLASKGAEILSEAKPKKSIEEN